MALDNNDAEPTPIKVAIPVLIYVNGVAIPTAVIAFSPSIWPAKIPSISGYKPITIIPNIAGNESLINICNGLAVKSSLLSLFI